MPSRFARALATLAAVASGATLLIWSAHTARGCGLDWALPRNHFEGVTNQGYVSYWEKIGEVDCGEGLMLPLHINFNSRRDGGTPSPYLGQGWMLALLESKFVQESEDRFNMIQPDGLNNLFLRAEKGGSVLNGSSSWKGEITGDTITAWASCGWKLAFTNGHITSMTTAKGRKLDWVYEGGKVSELREGNATRLKVEYEVDGRMQALVLPTGERILMAQDKKPRVQTVAGQNIIAGVESSLSHLVLADGRVQSFTFGTNKKVFPTLEIEGLDSSGNNETETVRQIIWDPLSKLAVQDGEWTYRSTSAKDAGSNAAIERINQHGQSEYWFKDDAEGKETVTTLDGIKYVRSWFTSGALAGKNRKIERLTRSGIQTTYRADYGLDGMLIKSYELISGDIPLVMRPLRIPRSEKTDFEKTYAVPGGGKVVTRYSHGIPILSSKSTGTVIYTIAGAAINVTAHGGADKSYCYIVRDGKMTIPPDESNLTIASH